MERSDSVEPDADAWRVLRSLTTARIGLGRAGVSQPTRHHLAFQLAHAQARDAVHATLDVTALAADLDVLGLPSLRLRSAAGDRATYLQRPDLGRRLDTASREQVEEIAPNTRGIDAAFVVVDGLSALAVQRHAAPLLAAVQTLSAVADGSAPIAIVEQGRVAIGDEIGALLGAGMVVVLIGERPGLSSPDSLGVYLTWMPRIGRTDAERNCISNVRAAGLSYRAAAATLLSLMAGARRLGLTGVGLTAEPDALGEHGKERNGGGVLPDAS